MLFRSGSFLLLLFVTFTESLKKFPLLMPNVKPAKIDSYLCTPIRIDPSQNYYITAFEPNATSDVAHHMLLFGCGSPGSSNEVWNCGEMSLANPGLNTAPVCGSGSQILYGWAKDAPKLELPEGVGFKVGGSSEIKYLVLQVHYASIDKFKDGSTDDSGVHVYFTEKPLPKSAGVLLMGTGGRIMPNSVEYMETACQIDEDITLHPFAFRTHTHSLGRVVSGYKVSYRGGKNEWKLIGKKDPQLPQMFYPVDNELTIKKGDSVAARCTMQSDRSTVTRVGSTDKHEMCNFYMMYWSESKPLKKKSCFSLGPPIYYWQRDGLDTIPDKDASTLSVGSSAQDLGIKSHIA